MWLISNDARAQMAQMLSSGITVNSSAGDISAASHSSMPQIMTAAGGVATITVTGILTPTQDVFARMFGGGNTTYGEIQNALAAADADESVVRAEMIIDSPGGNVNGLFDALAAMQMFSKPLSAIVANRAESAAYALASQADSIIATNPMARFGSIGVAVSIGVDDSRVDIASDNAPKKRPDPMTEQGKAVIRDELNALHEIFADAIAAGRNVSAQKVNSDFGQGATLVAKDAVARGMVDSLRIESLNDVSSTTASGGNQQRVQKMDLNTLRTDHAAVYAEAVSIGQAEERDRVNAHLTMGGASGDMATAVAAVNDGSAMTATLQATYMAAGMNRRDTEDRAADDADASAADDADTANATGDTAAEAVAAIVERQLGTNLEA